MPTKTVLTFEQAMTRAVNNQIHPVESDSNPNDAIGTSFIPPTEKRGLKPVASEAWIVGDEVDLDLLVASDYDILFFRQFPVGMFKAEVNENAFFSAARSDSERYGDTGYNLKSILEVIGPANSRVQQKIARPLCDLRRGHLLTANEHCLEQYIEARMSQPNNALAEVVTEGSSRFSGGISGVRNDCGSGIPVRYQFSVEHHAKRE